MSIKGRLIVIEGLEGAGKSTAVTTVLDVLAQHNIPAINTREPGGTAIGEQLRKLFKSPEYKDLLSDKSELLLLYAARIQLFEEVIKPALQAGKWVVADRFELSSFAYQGGGRGLDMHFMKQLSAYALEGFTADLTIFLQIQPEAGLHRVRLRGEFDRIEQLSLEFFNRVYCSYNEQVKSNPNTHSIDAQRTVVEVQQDIQKLVKCFLNKHE